MKKAYQTKEMSSEEPARAPFSLPEIQVNPSGWGPSTIETKFKDMPYQPFSKSDRLGKVCHSVLEQILIKGPYLDQRLPQHESP